MRELIIDSFAGGGGASTGIELALGRSPDIAINHDAIAMAMHRINHPATMHIPHDIWKVDPAAVCRGRPVGVCEGGGGMSGMKHHPRTIHGSPPRANDYADRFLTPLPKTYHAHGRSYDDLVKENAKLRNTNNRLRALRRVEADHEAIIFAALHGASV
jgi:hypothetical protein